MLSRSTASPASFGPHVIASPRSQHSLASSPSHRSPRSQLPSERGDSLHEENLSLVNRLVLLRGVLEQMTVDAPQTRRALRRARAENRVLRREPGLIRPRE